MELQIDRAVSQPTKQVTLNNLALCESKSLREESIKGFSQNKALETLDKAKGLVMALHQGASFATSTQIAKYFEVSIDTIQQIVGRNKLELESDGLKLLRGKDLKDVIDKLSVASSASSLTIWTPRAALRCGMLLRDSIVAKQVRTVLLDIAQGKESIYNLERQFLPEAPTLKELKEVNDLLKSAGFKQEYIERLTISNLKKHYPASLSLLPEATDSTSLPTAKALLTPTQIATQLGFFCKSNPTAPDPKQVNKLLEELGYQTKVAGLWSTTSKAIDLNLCDRKPVETGSRSQKDQLLWSAGVISILQEHSIA